jgi:steroid delta-isomerase-like uncharacterized protein
MDNKKLCITFLDEVHNKHNLGAIDTYVSKDVVSHDPMPGQRPGIEGIKETMELFRSSFPNKRIVINDTMAENDKVMVKLTCFGTYKGEFMGMPATDNPIEYEEVVIFRLNDGKIVEHWAVADALGLMQAVGAASLKF